VVDKGDPHFGKKGLHPWIDNLQQAYCKEDLPPERVKPIPIQLVQHAMRDRQRMDMFLLAVFDLIIIGFFFLLHPREHVYIKENDHPF